MGTLFCLASGAAFGAMGVFGKLAYGEGATVGTLLAVRFTLAAALFWAARRPRGRRARGARRVTAGRRAPSLARRDDLALGPRASAPCGYALQAGCYFAALERIDASLLSLLVFTFPAIVAAAAIALGRERADSRRLGALIVARGGHRAGRRRGRRGRAGPARRRARPDRRGHLQRVHPRQRGDRQARAPARPRRAGLHRRGGRADARLGRARRPAPRRADRRRVGLARGAGGDLDRRRDRALLRRPRAGRDRPARRSSPPSSRS